MGCCGDGPAADSIMSATSGDLHHIGKHRLAPHGVVWVGLMTLVNLIRRRTEPRLKLH